MRPAPPPKHTHRSYIYLSDEDFNRVLPGGTTMGASVRAEALTTPSVSRLQQRRALAAKALNSKQARHE